MIVALKDGSGFSTKPFFTDGAQAVGYRQAEGYSQTGAAAIPYGSSCRRGLLSSSVGNSHSGMGSLDRGLRSDCPDDENGCRDSVQRSSERLRYRISAETCKHRNLLVQLANDKCSSNGGEMNPIASQVACRD